MAFTQAQLFALESAIALGLEEVTYPDGTRKRYRSLEEMRSLASEMRQALGMVKSSSRRRFAEFKKGT